MKHFLFLFACLLPVGEIMAKGHASVEWIPESPDVAKGSVLRTVVRMNIDKGWHTYWENPGEVGIPVSIKAELPEGWEAGEIQFPVPHRITASELTSFCFEGVVLLPLTVTPPPGYAGKVPGLRATVSWLACDDQACVPGKQDVALRTDPDPDQVSKGYEDLPRQLEGAKLAISEDGNSLRLRLDLPADWKADISGFSVFPITRSILSPAKEFKFSRDPGTGSAWTAIAQKDEYFDKLPESFSILVSDGSGKSWVIGTAADPAPE